MAWVCTSMSLITFGYRYYKVIEFSRSEVPVHISLVGSREFGLIMISVGLLPMIFRTYEHNAPCSHCKRSAIRAER